MKLLAPISRVIRAADDATHRLPNLLALVLVAAFLTVGARLAAAVNYTIEVQSGGPGTVTPSGLVEVPAGGNQTFTFTPSGCAIVGDVQVDGETVGSGLTEYTFTNVQSDHVLYVPFGFRSTTTTLEVRPATGQCAVPETLTATVLNADGGEVQFFMGQNLLGTRTLASGTATYVVSGLGTGSYVFSASYLGTSCSYPSTAPDVPYDVAGTGPVPVTLDLTASTSTTHLHDYVVFGTTLRIGGQVADLEGFVTYYDGTTVPPGGVVEMRNGLSGTMFRMETPGARAITAVAQISLCGTTVTSAPVTVVVSEEPRTTTNTTLTISPPSVNPGESVLLTAVIDQPNATGLVQFVNATNHVEVGRVYTANGVATFTYGPLSGSDRVMQAWYNGDSEYLPSFSNDVLMRIDQPVATLLAQFDATSGPDGIELRWSFGDASSVSSTTVERAPDAVGPWLPITPEQRHDGDVTAALDRTTDSGQTYFYRLDVRLVDGSSVSFGPISSTASAFIGESAVNLLAPNPARTASQIQYSVARAGHVRLDVTDVAGRVVTTLFDGIQQSGRFQLAWDGTNRGERLPAGLYFVRLTTLDRTVARKFARLP